MKKEVDQCLGYKLREPINSRIWYKNVFKAPIPTRHQIWDYKNQNLWLRVISTIEFTGPDRGIEWHLSISENSRYPRPVLIEKVRKEFDALNFEQDDHNSSVAHLWLPVERDKRGECDCK